MGVSNPSFTRSCNGLIATTGVVTVGTVTCSRLSQGVYQVTYPAGLFQVQPASIQITQAMIGVRSYVISSTAVSVVIQTNDSANAPVDTNFYVLCTA